VSTEGSPREVGARRGGAPGRMSLASVRLQRSDFERIHSRGRRAHGAWFSVIVLENGGEATRMGLSVSKRRARLAVDRNRFRRILREAFRQCLPELPRGVDVVLVATSTRGAPSLAAARAELPALVGKALRKRPRDPARRKEPRG